jgi:hypothetical protein
MVFAISAFPPSAAIVRAAKQIDRAASGKVSNSFTAALTQETGRVLGVIASLSLPLSIAMLSDVTTSVKKARTRPNA